MFSEALLKNWVRGKLSSEKEADESSSQALDLVKKTNKSVKQISDEVSNVVLGRKILSKW